MKTVRELIALAGLVFSAAVVSDFYSRLPERIATHFKGAGGGEWVWGAVDALGIGGDCGVAVLDTFGCRLG